MRSLFKKSRLLRLLPVLFLSFFTLNVFSQDNAHFESWNTYIGRKYVSKHRFWYRTDLGIRPSFDTDRSTMYLLRPRFIINLWSVAEFVPAVDFRFSHYYESENTFEIRTWQGLKLHWPDVGRVMFDHFYRFEQRFHWLEGMERDKISLRSRYRLNMRVPLNRRAITDNTFYSDLRAEAFLPHDDGVQETYASTIRVGLAIAYRQNSKWQYQLIGYFDGGKNSREDERSASRYMIEARVRTTF